ncbi:MAG: malonyl-CoA decarboxylase family protein [Candidatus Microthrix sp.]|uniref:Malonyl-CoA decarboxylase family protein n=1 Tax=Candidatus Neomicrothrix subdominans TaxID=2954438 RepID=A0A936NBV9_9ACTN|nr:malonyl-CoA decarboxylase family protein [Candidatus Microthrix subdominans]
MVSHEADELASPLPGLAARYLTDTGATGRSPDPVANFHLGNGARLMRLCWAANRSPRGSASRWASWPTTCTSRRRSAIALVTTGVRVL